MRCQMIFFFLSLSLRRQMLLFLKCSNQSHKQGLIYSIQSLLSQKHPWAIRSFLSIGLQWNKFEFRAKRRISLDHILHKSMQPLIFKSDPWRRMCGRYRSGFEAPAWHQIVVLYLLFCRRRIGSKNVRKTWYLPCLMNFPPHVWVCMFSAAPPSSLQGLQHRDNPLSLWPC